MRLTTIKIFISLLLLIISISGYTQNYYYYALHDHKTSDKPNFFNVDSLLALKNIKASEVHYSVITDNNANFDMTSLGEHRSRFLVQNIDHTFLRDLDIALANNDTVLLKMRAYVYPNEEFAINVFNSLNKKVVSAITVPRYRIMYREGSTIYFISLKGYHKDKKSSQDIISNVYEALAGNKNNVYLLFKHDLRIHPKK